MASDIKAIRVTATGDVGVGPARIRAIHVNSGGGAGRLTITDGVGGSTIFDGDFDASDTNFVDVPDMGIRAEVGLRVTAITNINSITVLYS